MCMWLFRFRSREACLYWCCYLTTSGSSSTTWVSSSGSPSACLSVGYSTCGTHGPTCPDPSRYESHQFIGIIRKLSLDIFITQNKWRKSYRWGTRRSKKRTAYCEPVSAQHLLLLLCNFSHASLHSCTAKWSQQPFNAIVTKCHPYM